MNWTEEDRPEFVERIVDGMVAQLTLEEMRQTCWDLLYDELLTNDWTDLFMHAEEYAPDLLGDG
jgi:hypothetical protein